MFYIVRRDLTAHRLGVSGSTIISDPKLFAELFLGRYITHRNSGIDHEENGFHFKIQEAIKLLSRSKDVYFVLEHTPHLNPGQSYVEDGAQWLQELIANNK